MDLSLLRTGFARERPRFEDRRRLYEPATINGPSLLFVGETCPSKVYFVSQMEVEIQSTAKSFNGVSIADPDFNNNFFVIME